MWRNSYYNHIVTLNLVWAAEQVIELFLPALCRTLFMFSLSWNVNWVPPCAETLANPAASILPSKRSNFKSAHGAQCRIRILQHLADACGIFSVHSIVTYLQSNCAPPHKKKKSCCLPIFQSKWRAFERRTKHLTETHCFRRHSQVCQTILFSLLLRKMFSRVLPVFKKSDYMKLRHNLRGDYRNTVCIMGLILLFKLISTQYMQ